MSRSHPSSLLRRNEDYYRNLFNLTSDAITIIDAKTFYIVDVNPAALKLYGYTRKEFLKMHPWDISCQVKETKAALKKVLSGRLRKVPLRYHHKKDGSVFPIEIIGTSFAARNKRYIIGIFRDITRRVQTIEKLQQSEERFRQIAENIEGLVYMMDPVHHQTLYISPNYEKIWGKTTKSLYKDPNSWMDTIYPDDRSHVLQAFKTQKQGNTFNEVYRIVRPDGSVRWVRDRNFPIRDKSGNPYRLVGIVEDITDRKRAEESLAYSREIIEAQEAERRRVARELHDSVGQILSSIQFRAHSMKNMCRSSQELSHIDKCLQLLDQARDEVRRISHNLRPSLLDDLGLTSALASACDDFRERSGLRLRFHHTGLNRHLPANVELALYRIAQEALSNIEKHSGATRVALQLHRKNGRIAMIIQDNGKGLKSSHTKRKPSSHSGHGLASMAERAAAAGGSVTITCPPGLGTSVAVEMPLP